MTIREALPTNSLDLRRFTAADGLALHAYLGRREAVEFEPYGALSAEQAAGAAAERAADARFWAVDLRAGSKPRRAPVPRSGRARLVADLRARLRVPPRPLGTRLRTEACTALLNEVFAGGAHRVVAGCNPANTRSWALLERLGLRREAHTVRSVAFTRDAEDHPLWHDAFRYAILADEWSARR